MIQDALAAAQQVAPVTTDFSTYAIVSGLVMYAQKYMKSFNIYQAVVKAVPGADKWAHRVIALLGSLIGAAGIAYAFSYDPQTGGSLLITLPSAAVAAAGLKSAAVLYLGQQFAYDATRTRDTNIDMVVKSPAPTVVVAAEVPPGGTV